MGEEVLGYLIMIFVLGFFGYCVWVLNPKHPERLEKLKEFWGSDDIKFN